MRRIPSTWLGRGILFGALLLIIIGGTLVAGMLFTTHSQAAAKMGTPEDPNILYVGRWDTSNSALYISYWPGAYFKTSFTGTTVKVKLKGFSTIYASIDHRPDMRITSIGPTGIVDFTRTPLKPGTHTLRIAVVMDTDSIFFQGLLLDPGATTVPPVSSSPLIEFIGDSITAGATDSYRAMSDYAWLTAERLFAEHTQIAEGGMCLVNNVLCGAATTIGMSQQYFKLQPTYFDNSSNWNFSRYQASIVVINLGTNDQGNHVSDARFQATYITFLHDVRAKYPHALIFGMEPFDGAENAFIQAAIQAVNAAGDHNVRYIATTGWLQSGGDDFSDDYHPSDTGQAKIADRLEPVLAAAMRSF